MSDAELRWLRRIGRLWILKAEMAVPALMGSTLLATVVLTAVGRPGWIAPAAAVLLGASFCSAIAQHLLFFHAIRCPACGYNPTRSKKEHKKMSVKLVWARLRPLEECPECDR